MRYGSKNEEFLLPLGLSLRLPSTLSCSHARVLLAILSISMNANEM